jgi:hypothetical protein
MQVDGTLQVDADGNGIAEMAITMTGVTAASLSQSDFLWV